MLSVSSMPATPSTPVRARTPLYAVGGFLPSLDRAAHGMTPPEHLERSAIAHDLDSIGMHSANELARLTRLRQNEVDHLLDAEVCPASACVSHPPTRSMSLLFSSEYTLVVANLSLTRPMRAFARPAHTGKA